MAKKKAKPVRTHTVVLLVRSFEHCADDLLSEMLTGSISIEWFILCLKKLLHLAIRMKQEGYSRVTLRKDGTEVK